MMGFRYYYSPKRAKSLTDWEVKDIYHVEYIVLWLKKKKVRERDDQLTIRGTVGCDVSNGYGRKKEKKKEKKLLNLWYRRLAFNNDNNNNVAVAALSSPVTKRGITTKKGKTEALDTYLLYTVSSGGAYIVVVVRFELFPTAGCDRDIGRTSGVKDFEDPMTAHRLMW